MNLITKIGLNICFISGLVGSIYSNTKIFYASITISSVLLMIGFKLEDLL
jgi:hypothetical protein